MLLKFSRTVFWMFAGACVASCASYGDRDAAQWAAYGYLRPSPTDDGVLIGLFDRLDDCRAAADDWASRQVVGNPVYAQCYTVDTN